MGSQIDINSRFSHVNNYSEIVVTEVVWLFNFMFPGTFPGKVLKKPWEFFRKRNFNLALHGYRTVSVQDLITTLPGNPLPYLPLKYKPFRVELRWIWRLCSLVCRWLLKAQVALLVLQIVFSKVTLFTHIYLNKIVAISQTTFSNVFFSWTKNFVLLSKFRFGFNSQ